MAAASFQAHPVDTAGGADLTELPGGAMVDVPAPGVDHKQAAVGVFQHVGRVEVRIVAGDKIGVLAAEGGARRHQGVATDLAGVVLREKN